MMQLVPPDHAALWQRAIELTDEDRVMHASTITLMQEAVTRVSAAGLAAPQLGLSLRLFVTSNLTFPVVINPTFIQVGTGFVSKPERCLSRIDYTTFVRRPENIEASWQDVDGAPKSTPLTGIDARVFLHLFDLLDGKPIFPRPIIRA